LITFAMLGVIFFLILFFTIRGLLSRSKNDVQKEKKVKTLNEDVDRSAEEFIPESEDELKKLFDELDRQQQK
ncbi:MAG: hypothetical protein K2I70_04915, partial [Bacilli bacterium]|nr:hypothetical protein [Bacilli bacterium]